MIDGTPAENNGTGLPRATVHSFFGEKQSENGTVQWEHKQRRCCKI
jgi:hypothetical protein